LLQAAIRLSPTGIEIVRSPDIGILPLYNPDLKYCIPDSVARFPTQVADFQALLIASQEYFRAVTGAIKNTLNWLVSFELFGNKPVALLNTSAMSLS
jgi:NAD(P)H-dependent FMN reductase